MVLIDYFADGLKPGLIKWNVPGAAKVPEINYYLFVVFFCVLAAWRGLQELPTRD